MPVIRVEKNKDFTVMSNYHLRDPRLTMKARGLLSTMLSLPPDWDYTVAGLAKLAPDGVASVRSALEELEAAGYMRRSQTHDGGGKFAGTDYVIFEQPAGALPNSPLCENRTTAPLCDFPTTEKPLSENRTQVNTERINTIPPIVPQGGQSPPKSRRAPKTTAEWKSERFEALWAYYPLHMSRQAAIRAWDRLKPSDELIARMGKTLRSQKGSEMWRSGVGIPYLSSYLNQRRWEDEPAPPQDSPGGWAASQVVIV